MEKPGTMVRGKVDMIYQYNYSITRVRYLEYIDKIYSYIFRLAIKINLSLSFLTGIFMCLKFLAPISNLTF